MTSSSCGRRAVMTSNCTIVFGFSVLGSILVRNIMSPRETSSRAPTSFHLLPCNTNLSGQSITRQLFHAADALHATWRVPVVHVIVARRVRRTSTQPCLQEASLELVVLQARISERQFCIEFDGTHNCGRLISEAECDELASTSRSLGLPVEEALCLCTQDPAAHGLIRRCVLHSLCPCFNFCPAPNLSAVSPCFEFNGVINAFSMFHGSLSGCERNTRVHVNASSSVLRTCSKDCNRHSRLPPQFRSGCLPRFEVPTSLNVVDHQNFEVSLAVGSSLLPEILLFTSPNVIDEVLRVPVVSCCSV